ncbi:FliH/SctL family protein [Paenisporosarcina quisquiliarum]|uniref:FliH/SctL family protein n=1 Tax=Paenisporosarcina quisquiliarum TaxID=365346 RepID=A0A9X3RCW8_9BACL|nr:FliH/SctL family protein [Paenisporosarcina quisquiliarum]MCZ8536911.1 FliH/SctL family protein [Paenisporosarcina quisquiliarum]
MSNIIRSHTIPTIEKKIIQTKKIENKTVDIKEQEIDPVLQQQNLIMEIKALEIQYSELQRQMKNEMDSAQSEIDQWWSEKQYQAQEEARRLAKEASEQGFKAGFEQGTLFAEEEFRQKRMEMQVLIETAYEEKAKIVQESESFLLSLSVRVAEKVIKKELKQHDDQLLNIVKQALRQIEESEDVVMQVSLEDYPIILPFLEELKTYVKADSEFKLIPVANLSKGGCMIHTASGSYDATIDSQLQEIKKHLLAYCEEKTNDEPKGR